MPVHPEATAKDDASARRQEYQHAPGHAHSEHGEQNHTTTTHVFSHGHHLSGAAAHREREKHLPMGHEHKSWGRDHVKDMDANRAAPHDQQSYPASNSLHALPPHLSTSRALHRHAQPKVPETDKNGWPAKQCDDVKRHEWRVFKGTKRGKEERCIIIDLNRQLLIQERLPPAEDASGNKPFSGEGKSFGLSCIRSIALRGDTAAVLSFDVTRQRPYTLWFATVEEQERFADVMNRQVLGSQLVASGKKPLPDLNIKAHYDKDQKNKIFTHWKANIEHDPMMILKSHPTWWTWLTLQISQLTSVRTGEQDVEGDISVSANIVSVEQDEQEKGHAIHPKSVVALTIAMISGICLLYTVIFAPYTLAFYWFAELCEGTPFDTMDMIVEVVFLAEIVMNFLIGRYTDNGKYLGHFRQIALDYAFGGFLNNLGFDALTSIPIAWFEFSQRRDCPPPGVLEQLEAAGEEVNESSDIQKILRMVKIIKPLRLLRLLRMLKLLNHKALKNLRDSIEVEPDTIRLFNVGLMVFMSCHFAGCLFWLVKSLSSDREDVNDFLQAHKLRGANGSDLSGWFCGRKLPPDYPDCETVKVQTVYILCFYWAMTTLTTVGYGDIGGTNSEERIYCAMLQIFGTVVFATIMNQLSMVLDNMNFHAQEKEFRLTKCRRWLTDNFVDPKLTRKILAWTGFQYTNDVSWNEGKEIMDLLPRTLRASLALNLHERRLSVVPIFYRSGSDFIAEIALSLVPERYNAGEQVASVGEIWDRMYMIYKGACAMRAPDGRHISVFTAGDYFGECCLIRTQIQKTNVFCLDFSEFWCLDKVSLDHILPHFPVIRRIIHHIVYDSAPETMTFEHIRLANAGKVVRGTVSGGLLRSLSMTRSEEGNLLPSAHLADADDDPVLILRWSFLVARSLRRLYVLDDSVRIENRIMTFGSKVFQMEEGEEESTADEEDLAEALGRVTSPSPAGFGKAYQGRVEPLQKRPSNAKTPHEGGKGKGKGKKGGAAKKARGGGSNANDVVLVASPKTDKDKEGNETASQSAPEDGWGCGLLPPEAARDDEDDTSDDILHARRAVPPGGSACDLTRMAERMDRLQESVDNIMWVLSRSRPDSSLDANAAPLPSVPRPYSPPGGVGPYGSVYRQGTNIQHAPRKRGANPWYHGHPGLRQQRSVHFAGRLNEAAKARSRQQVQVSEDSEMEQLLLGREGSVALAASAAIEPRGLLLGREGSLQSRTASAALESRGSMSSQELASLYSASAGAPASARPSSVLSPRQTDSTRLTRESEHAGGMMRASARGLRVTLPSPPDESRDAPRPSSQSGSTIKPWSARSSTGPAGGGSAVKGATVKYKASANGELSLDFVDSQGGDQVVPLDEQRPPSHRSPLQQRERDLTRSLSRTSTATSAAFASLNGSDMQGNLTVTESSAKRQRQPSEIGKW